MNKVNPSYSIGHPALFVLVMAFLLMVGACATSPREKKLEETEAQESAKVSQQLRTQFTAEQLSAEELNAFEARAKQKLQDFTDYVKLLSDHTLDSTFRQQATQQTLTLFHTPEDNIAVGNKNIAVKRYLQLLGQDMTDTISKTSHVTIYTPLQGNDSTYTGKLSFRSDNHESDPGAIRYAPIIVKKVRKSFGSQEEWVWEVFLSGIE